MPSQLLDLGWDFSSVIDLIDSDVHDISSPALQPMARPFPSVLQDNDGGVRLGSFAKLYKDLGFSNEVLGLPPLDPESELSNSEEVLLPSPVLKSVQAPLKQVDNAEDQPVNNTGLSKKQRQKARKQAEKERKEQTTKEEEQRAQLRKQLEALAGTSTKTTAPAVESPFKPARTQSRSNVGAKIRSASPAPVTTTDTAPIRSKEPKTPKAPRPVILKRLSTAQPVTPQAGQKAQAAETAQPPVSHTQYLTLDPPAPSQYPFPPQNVAQSQISQAATPIGRNQGLLVPRTVRPVTLPRHSQPKIAQQPTTPTPVVTPLPGYPTPQGRPAALELRSQVDRHFHLFNKLLNYFPDDRKWLISPMQLINERTTSHGLHVFVDASNIMIGYRDMLRNHGISSHDYHMSFDSLALLMERRRPVAKRVFAGSHREANPHPQVTKLVETSKAVGYDSVIQEQVLVVREDSEKKKFFNDVKKHGWHKASQLRSGSGSDSETGPPAPKTPSAPKWVEQGVDEILHLKMCQSIIDTEVPSTMVLATGDGAEAEMSDGFLAHVERALRKGWKVELISWRQQTNGGYKNKKFRAKWPEQFQIIELDVFLEDLIDTP